jgi:hypothetical protein
MTLRDTRGTGAAPPEGRGPRYQKPPADAPRRGAHQLQRPGTETASRDAGGPEAATAGKGRAVRRTPGRPTRGA